MRPQHKDPSLCWCILISLVCAVDSRSPSITHSNPQGSLDRIPEDAPSHRRRTQYDEDGFIVDNEPVQVGLIAASTNRDVHVAIGLSDVA